MELPADLARRIAEKTEGANREALTRAAGRISLRYREMTGQGRRLLTEDMEALAPTPPPNARHLCRGANGAGRGAGAGFAAGGAFAHIGRGRGRRRRRVGRGGGLRREKHTLPGTGAGHAGTWRGTGPWGRKPGAQRISVAGIRPGARTKSLRGRTWC